MKNIKFCMDQSMNNPYVSGKMNWFFAVFEFFYSVWRSARQNIFPKENPICLSSIT